MCSSGPLLSPLTLIPSVVRCDKSKIFEKLNCLFNEPKVGVCMPDGYGESGLGGAGEVSDGSSGRVVLCSADGNVDDVLG